MTDREQPSPRRWWRVELHCHTHYSRDCEMSFDALIAAITARRIDCIAITDHSRFAAAPLFRRVAPIPVIPGEEIKTSAGEIIGLFLRAEIPRGLSPEETIARIRDQGGVVYVPHPFDRLRKSRLREDKLHELVDRNQIDVLETYNARVLIPADNDRADRFATERGLRKACASDAHLPAEVGRAYLEMPPFDGPAEFLAALDQSRRVQRLSSALVHGWTSLSRWRTRLKLRELPAD